MAKKSRTEVFESLIADVDKLPNDMPQDFKYRKRGKDSANEAESGRAPVKMQPTTQSKVESKVQNVVNHMMETNNRFQTTQNTIIQQQTEINKDQLQQDRAQTSLLQTQQRTMSEMNETMSKLYLMMKQQNEKLSPKYQQRAANDSTIAANDPDAGKTKDDSAFDGLAGLLGGAIDMIGRRRRGGNRPNRQERADKRMRDRMGNRSGRTGSSGPTAFSAASMLERLKNGGSAAASKARSVGGAIVDGFRNVKGNRFTKIGGAILAGSAATWGGAELLKGSFGSVSEKYESGGRGVGTVSTGNGDHGGVSYGKHQLSSKSGTMGKFLQSEQGKKFAPYFEGLTPGSAAFNQVYSQVAKEREEEFALAQSSFIQETHYDPAMRKLQKNGIDFSERSRALNELVFSTATQYGAGGAPSKIMRALEGMDVNSMTDEQIITAIQDNKSANVGTDFRSSSYETQQSVAARAQREKADLLAMLKAEQDEKAGMESGEVERLRTAAKENEEGTVDESVATQSLEGEDVTVTQQAPVGVLPMAPEGGTIDPTTGAVSAGILTGAIAATAERMGEKKGESLAARRSPAKAVAVDPSAIRGREALAAESSILSTAEKGATKGGLVKGAFKGAVKGVPIVGPAVTALDVASTMSDDSLSEKEKERALAGIGMGAMVSAGATAGAAVGAGFFGLGAIPGALLGAGAGVIGYYAGQYLGETGYDIYDSATSEDEDTVIPDTPSAFVAPDSPVGIFPMANSVAPQPLIATSNNNEPSTAVTQKMTNSVDLNKITHAAPTAKTPSVAPAIAAPAIAAPAIAAPEIAAPEIAAPEIADTHTVNSPKSIDLALGKTTLMVVPIPMPAKVDTGKKESEVAQTPARKEPETTAPSVTDKVVDIGAKTVKAAVGTVEKAPAYADEHMNSMANAMVSSANAVTNAVSSSASNLVGSVEPVRPNIQITPPPKQTAAAWSALPKATPQRVEAVSASHDTPMKREAFTSVQPVNVENNVQPAPASTAQPRIQSNGISEGNSIRPELKDVPPMIADFGIVFLNAGII